MAEGEKAVTIPASLYARLSELVAASGAESVEELSVRIIRDWVSKQSAPSPKGKPSPISPEDEKIVEERLKSLGYM
jgi:hypothetical protein